MKEFNKRDPSELPGYLGVATMVVLLALAAENLFEGNTLTAIVLTLIAASCFYLGTILVARELESRNDAPAARKVALSGAGEPNRREPAHRCEPAQAG
jgi:hypothetical protein